MASLSGLFLNRNFTLLWFSRLISLFGDRLFLPAVMWMMLDSDGNSYSSIGVIAITLALPPLLSAMIGVYVDRAGKKTMMLVTDFLRFFLCVLLYANALWWDQLVVYVVLLFLLQLTSQFFNLAAQSLIPAVIEKDQLLKANSQFSIADNITSIIGYSVGGLLIALLGSQPLILWNGLTFFLSGVLLFFLKVPKATTDTDQPATTTTQKAGQPPKRGGAFWPEFKIGLKTAFSSSLITNLLLVAFLLNATSASMSMMMTIWARDVLGLDATGYGFLLVALLVGSLAGSILITLPFFKSQRVQVIISSSVCLFGLCLIALSQLMFLASSLVFFFLVGVSTAMTSITFSTLFMTSIPRDHLAKIIGIVQTVTRGGQPLGLMIVSSLLAVVAPKWIYTGMGSIILVGGLFLLYNLVLRPSPTASEQATLNG